MIPPTTNAPTSPHSTVRIGKKPAVAAVAALAVALAFVFVPRGEAPATPVAAPSAKASVVEPPPERATFPPPPAARAPVEPPPAAPTEEYGRSLCDACLPERAVLDVAETYLRRLDPVYLEGEIRVHPVADVVPEPIPRGHRIAHRVTLPKLPAGLVGAPEDNPFGQGVQLGYPVETAWFVWVQTGWISREWIEELVVLEEPGVVVVSPEEYDALESREVTLDELRPGVDWRSGVILETSGLPLAALSWPPIKKETYIVIDSRTGKLWPDGIFKALVGRQPWYPPHHGEALDMARERAGEWFRGEATLPPGA